MNKIRLFLIAAVLVISSGAAMAQKTGYVSIDQIIGIMPEVARIDSQMQKYQADSINQEYVSLYERYQYYDSLLTKTDTNKIVLSVRKQYHSDRDNIAYQIQNWQSIAQQAYQAKQNQLLEPVYRRVMTAVNNVAKEKGYTYVYDKTGLIIAPPGDDLLPSVAAKLNVKIPPNTPVGIR